VHYAKGNCRLWASYISPDFRFIDQSSHIFTVYTVELYARVRRAVVVDKMSERESARQFALARETVRKMLRYSIPPGYRLQQPARRPKLDAWTGIIDQILEQDKAQGKKQRHTAKRIFERLRDEHAFIGGYTIVKD
jgi:transposase